MEIDLQILLAGTPLFGAIVVALARPFAFSVLFVLFSWGGLNGGILRMIFVFAISFPVIAPLVKQPGLSQDLSYFVLFQLLMKELFLGFLLGWFASKPFDIASGGGHIVDSYRNGTSGDADPSGGQITAYSKLFFVASIFVFTGLGGFWIIANAIYLSYNIWPLFALLPFNDATNLTSAIGLMDELMVGALIVAGPLVIFMILSDVAFLFAAKFGKQINTFHLAFTMKNLVAICLVPLFLLVLQRVLPDYFKILGGDLSVLKDLF